MNAKRVSFVLMIIRKINLPQYSIQSLAVATVLLFVLSACASNGRSTDQEPSSIEPPPVILSEPTSDDVMYRVFAGEYLGAEGDLQAAADEYLEAAIESSDPEIARRATRIAFAAESWQQAAMAADRWALLAPESVPAHESAATAMLNVGDYFGAEYQLIQILEILGDSTDAWVLVSRILSRAGDPAQADLVVEHLAEVRTGADPANVYFARSQLAVQGRKLNEAFEFARRAAELNPDRPEFLTWAGRVALNLDLQETGTEYIRRAWEIDPENHDLALGYADLLARAGDAEAARKVMREMPQSPDVMLSRILFEITAKNRDGALALLNEFESMKFEDADEKAFYQAQAAEALVLHQQAIKYYSRVQNGDRVLAASLRRAELVWLGGDEKSARETLEEIREQPSDLAVEQSWLTEARILRESGAKEESFEVLDQGIMQLPSSIALLYSHSLLAAELGRVDIAENDLRTILAAQPDNAAALNALGYTLADQTDRFEEAEALIRQAYILQPNEASIVDSMGWIAYRLGKNAEAIEFLTRAWELDRNPEIAAHLGEVLWVSGQQDNALAIWRAGAEIDQSNYVLAETLRRLGIEL